MGLSDLILSFAAQTGPPGAWERFVMGIWKMTGTWQNVTRPSDCVRTSSPRFSQLPADILVHLSVVLPLENVSLCG